MTASHMFEPHMSVLVLITRQVPIESAHFRSLLWECSKSGESKPVTPKTDLRDEVRLQLIRLLGFIRG